MDRITSRTNSLLSHIRRLSSDAAYRRQSGQFVGDSPKLLREALQWGVEPACVVCTEGVALPTLPEGVRVVCVPGDVMASVSPMKSPQGVLFTGRIPALAPPEKLTGRRYVALEGVQDPGNVGTILRTIDAAGFTGLMLDRESADAFSPKALRASMGAAFRIPIRLSGKLAEDLQALSGFAILAGSLQGSPFFERPRLGPRVCLLIGNEGAGLSEAIQRLATLRVKLPMPGRAESLNAALAAGIMMYDFVRTGESTEAG